MLSGLLTALALMVAPLQQDTVTVTAALSDSRIAVGGTTTLVVNVESQSGGAPDIRLPALPPALQVLGTSDYSETRIGIPGGRTRITRREISILAMAPGVYRLGAVSVRTGGSIYRSRELQLVVTGNAPAGVAETGGTRSSLRTWVTPDTVYVGQQVLLQAEVTFAEDFRMRQSRPATFDPPSPSGFWIQDLPDPITISLRVRDGRSVETQTYRRAYFPLNPGEYRIPPARLHYEVRRGFLFPPEARELVSDSPAVVVLPLPENGQPPSFTGAVGSLTMTATLSPERVRVGEPAVLTVELQGSGNVKAMPEPRRPQLTNAELFPPTQESVPAFDDTEVGGTKRFQWMVVPNAAGALVIPPVEYAVFDPELRAYIVLRSDSLRLEALPAIVATVSDTALRGLRASPGRGVLDWTGSPLFLAAQAAPLALLAGAFLLRRRRALPPAPRDEAKHIRAELAALRGMTPDGAWAARMEHVLRDAVRRITGVASADPVGQLRAAGSGDAAERLAALLAALNTLRFAPGAHVDTRRLLDDADAFVESLLPKRGHRGAAGAAMLLLFVATALAAQERTFADATAAFEKGDYAGAWRGFREYTRARPHDANGWHNLGLAAQRAGNPGLAGWAWLRGVEQAPRDADMRHNLSLLGAGASLSTVLPADRLAPGERSLLLAVCWWLLLLGIAAAVLRRRRTAAGLAAPGAVGLLVLGILSLAVGLRPRVVTPLGTGIAVHAAPTTREEALARLEPGSVATILEQRERWLLVRTATGASGWVERAGVAEP